MNRTRTGALLIGASLVVASGCTTTEAQGEVERQAREIAPFERLHLIRAGRIVLEQNDAPGLVVETRSGALERVRTEVVDGVLELEFDPGVVREMRTPDPLVYHVSVQRLAELRISGSGSFEAAALETDSLDIDVAGSGEVVIEALAAEAIDAEIGGSGQFELGGEVGAQSIEIGGSGRYEAMGLASREATVRIAGSGEARVEASETLDVEISGSGQVEYAGEPRVSSRVSGAGSVRNVVAD